MLAQRIEVDRIDGLGNTRLTLIIIGAWLTRILQPRCLGKESGLHCGRRLVLANSAGIVVGSSSGVHAGPPLVKRSRSFHRREIGSDC
jgi:hypothetical protein